MPGAEAIAAGRAEAGGGPGFLFDLRRGFGSIATAVKYGAPLLGRVLIGRKPSVRAVGVALRRYVEEMGMTYQKLGQYLAIRFDLLPGEICEELMKLFESVPPLDFDVVRQRVERELGGPLDQFFRTFDRTCLAAASIAQVHRAVGLDGQQLAVKIQRPGIERLFRADLRSMRWMAALVDKTGALTSLPLTETIDEFARFTASEMDFIVEGATADRLRHNDADLAKIPFVYWPLTTRRVLTMEFIEGVSLARLCQAVESGREEEIRSEIPNLDVPATLNKLSNTMLTQLYVRGFFHADPHPGNILIRPDGGIALVDFGIFGELSDFQRETLGRYVEALTLGAIDKAYEFYVKLLSISESTDTDAFEGEVKAMLAAWTRANLDPQAPISAKHVGRVADDLLRLLSRHHVRLDLNTLLFWRTLIVLDGTALRVGRHYDLMSAIRRFFEANRASVAERVASGTGARGYLAGAIRAGRSFSALIGDRVHQQGTVVQMLRARAESHRRARAGATRRLAAILALVSAAILLGRARWPTTPNVLGPGSGAPGFVGANRPWTERTTR